jgi:hypothetical protein
VEYFRQVKRKDGSKEPKSEIEQEVGSQDGTETRGDKSFFFHISPKEKGEMAGLNR